MQTLARALATYRQPEEPAMRSLLPTRHLLVALAAVLLLGLCLARPALARDLDYTGGASNQWNNSGNWLFGVTPTVPADGDTLLFDTLATGNYSSSNDLTNLALAGLAVGAPASSIAVTGNALSIGSGGIAMPGASASQLSLNLDLTLAASQAWNIASGRQLNLNGVIVAPVGTDLTLAGGGTVRFADASPENPDWNGDIVIQSGKLISRVHSQAVATAIPYLGTGTIHLQGNSPGAATVQFRGANDGNASRNRFDNSVAVGANQFGTVEMLAVGSGGRPHNLSGNLTLGSDAQLSIATTGSFLRYLWFRGASATLLAGSAHIDTGASTSTIIENAGGTTAATDTLLKSGSGRLVMTNPDFAANLEVVGGSLNLYWTSGSTSATFKQGSISLADSNLLVSQTGTGGLVVGRPLTVAGNVSITSGRSNSLVAEPGYNGNSSGAFSFTTLDLEPGATLTLVNQTNNATANPAFAIATAFDFAGAGALAINKTGDSASYTVNLPNTWNRGTQATLAFANSSAISSYATTATTIATNGVIGFATYNDSFASLEAGVIGELAGYSPLAAGPLAATTNYEATGSVVIDANQTINALRLANAAPGTLNLSGGTLAIQSGGLLFTGTADFAVASGQLGADNAELIVHQRSTANLTVNAAIAGSSANGRLTKTGPGTLTLDAPQSFGGTTQVNQGILALAGSGSLTGDVILHAAGTLSVAAATGNAYTLPTTSTLSGLGTVALGNTDLTIAGTVSPGFNLGELTFTSTGGNLIVGPTGLLQMEIDGFAPGEYDTIALTGGMFVAGGTLELLNLFAETPEIGTTIQLFEVAGNAFSGSFASILNTSLGDKLFWDTSNLLIDGTLSVVMIPEPTSALLLAIAALAVRRRRQGVPPMQRHSSAPDSSPSADRSMGVTTPGFSLPRFSLRFLPVVALFTAASVSAATYTWTQTAAGSHNWSTAGNWDVAGVPILPGGSTDIVNFLANTDTFVDGFALTATNDVGALTLNRLVPRGTGPASGSANITIDGATLTFDGATPRIDYDHRANLRYTIANDLVLNGNLQVATTSGNTLGPLSLTGQISGTGGLSLHRVTQNNTANLTVSNDLNSFTGSVYVDNGTLRFTSIANADGTSSALGAPGSAAASRIDMVSGGSSATLAYIGTAPAGHATDRQIQLNSSGVAGLNASGAGPLQFTTALNNAGNVNRGLTLSGGNLDANTLAGITGNAVNLTKSGASLWVIADTANINNLSLNRGVLRLAAGVSPGTGNLSFAEHHNDTFPTMLELADDFARPGGTGAGQVNFGSASRNSPGGFSAYGNDIRVAIGTLATPESLTWGVLPFKPGTVYLNSAYANGTLDFLNPIDLNGAVRTLEVGASTAILSGTLTGTGSSGLTKTGAGTLIVSGDNSYSGNTTASGGMLVAGHANAFGNTGSVTIGAGARLGIADGVTFVRPVTWNSAAAGIAGDGTYQRTSNWAVPTGGAGFTISPGFSTGTLTIDLAGNTLTLASNTTTRIELAADNDFDVLAVVGNVVLAGNLELVLLDGYLPVFGTTFDVITASGGLTGTINLVGGYAEWFSLALVNDDTTLRLTSLIPEPTSALLLALAALAVRRRR